MKLGVDTPIDIFATGICAAVVDVLTTRVGTANGPTSVSLYGQNQRANYHCAYKTELAKHCPIFPTELLLVCRSLGGGLPRFPGTIRADSLREITASEVPIRCEHTVQNEDTLTALARDYYGDPGLADVIYQANRHVIDDRDDLVPGWKLRIPEIETAVA